MDVDARMLDRAEGVLIALRRCTTDAAFAEIVGASKRHRVPTLSIAAARTPCDRRDKFT